MPRYWVIAPFHATDPNAWNEVWNYDLEHGLISIGWREIGDVSSLDETEIRERLCDKWPDYEDHSGKAPHCSRMLHKFFHAIVPGDVVIARRGRKSIAAIGTVKSEAYYDPEKLRDVFGRFRP